MPKISHKTLENPVPDDTKNTKSKSLHIRPFLIIIYLLCVALIVFVLIKGLSKHFIQVLDVIIL